MSETLKKKECLRCGHTWFPRTPSKPRVCPKCHNVYWDVPKKESLNPSMEKSA